MVLSPAEIHLIVRRAAARSSKRRRESLRRMLAGLGDPERNRQQGALEELCAIGVAYGWRELERTIRSSLLKAISGEAQANLRHYLQETLEWITRPCLDLEW